MEDFGRRNQLWEGCRGGSAGSGGEAWLGDEKAPAPANGGGTRERRRLRGQTKEDLQEKVIIFKGPHHRRAGMPGDATTRLTLLTPHAGCRGVSAKQQQQKPKVNGKAVGHLQLVIPFLLT